MNKKLSIIIPSRDERFLTPTIDDIFRNARGECEVVAVLDSDKWPADWKEVTGRHPNLHTVHNGRSIGMRGSINKGIASAISRGAKFVAKFDGHCSFSEGFDEVLKADCDEDWIIVPRRGRLDPENWCETELQKPPIDYHYLSFPDDPNDFGGPGLNGKVWVERAIQRKDIPIDEEMSSQGSGWFMHASYFQRLELMDHVSYGDFWCEFQELGLKCWLSGGQVKVNKKCKYLHLHKGSKYGRGYRLPESALVQGRNHTMKWIWNEAWDKQTLPFSWLINHFWPVPSWPENWEEVLYAERQPRPVGPTIPLTLDTPRFDVFVAESPDVDILGGTPQPPEALVGSVKADDYVESLRPVDGDQLNILSARYGILGSQPPFKDHSIDVRKQLQSLVVNNSLDIVVNNSTLCLGQNPFRGKKKVLLLTYSWGDREGITIEREEKEWLIIGQALQNNQMYQAGQQAAKAIEQFGNAAQQLGETLVEALRPMSAAALNDYLIRKFSISPQRLRGPMPIELRDFHRNDLAQLFAELGFKRGAEIGVAEGKYSEVLVKANPQVELHCIDPWYSYPTNPQGKTKQRHEFAYNEAKRKMEGYNAHLIRKASIDAVRDFETDSLDFVYVDGNHLFDFVMLDLIAWSNKVRSGGIVSGDDYYALDQKRWVGGGVVEAVQAYTNAHQIPIWYIFAGYKSVDFMWVKP